MGAGTMEACVTDSGDFMGFLVYELRLSGLCIKYFTELSSQTQILYDSMSELVLIAFQTNFAF